MRLVNYYQLWMHEVFPKAKFRDCIQMTEKAGHETRLRMMRKEWIDGTRSRVAAEEPDWDALQALVDGDRAREAVWEAKEREGMLSI
jgi:replication fork protection complex subunit Csm3/Swi3